MNAALPYHADASNYYRPCWDNFRPNKLLDSNVQPAVEASASVGIIIGREPINAEKHLMSSESLIAAGEAQAEQSAKFDQFLTDNYQLLVGYLYKRADSLEDAQDIAQESVTRLMRYSHHPPQVLKHLLFRIALNVLSDSGRRNRVRLSSAYLDMDFIIGEAQSSDLTPDEHAQHQEELILARNAILRLPTHCKQIYLLNRIDGLTYSQIALKYNISVKAVEKQMSKALTLINRHLAINGAGRGKMR